MVKYIYCKYCDKKRCFSIKHRLDYLRWKLFVYLKSKVDPRKGCELRLMWNPKLNIIDATTYNFPVSFTYEKEGDYNSLRPMDEFSYNLREKNDPIILGWINDFFRYNKDGK